MAGMKTGARGAPAANPARAALADRLRAVREAAHLSQEDFGERLGVSKNTVWRYERGEHPADGDVLVAICAHFDVAPHWLLTGRGEMYAGQQAGAGRKVSEDLVRAVIIHTEEHLQRERLAPTAERKAQLVLTICELLERQGFDTNSPLDLSQFENVIRLVR
jgi:transcriptional regulator with XRE-family HTH domain